MNTQPIPTAIFLEKLCVFGARPVGSPANQAATDFVRNAYAGFGLDVFTQPYACPYWELESATLRLDGRGLDFTLHLYAPDCDVQAVVTACGTLAELRAADVAGKLLVLHGDIAARPTIAPYYCYATEPDPTLTLLMEKRPAAVVAVETNPLNTFSLIENWDFPIPSGSVTPESGRTLLQSIGQAARLAIRGQRVESSAANVVARTPGAAGARRVVLCAHFDTAFHTPGAIDNASGSAVLYAAAAHCAARGTRVPLEFVAFNGEDSGGVDFSAYAAQVHDFENMVAVINIDGVGSWFGSPTITVLGGGPALENLVERVVVEIPGLARVDPWYESDHSMFFFRGVPAVAISSRGYPPVLHRPTDTPEWIDPARLEQVVEIVEKLIEGIADKL